MTFTMIIQLLIVLGALWVGSRYGSLALGAISGIGLALLVFCFHLKPGTPPTDVIYIIIAAVTCAGIMQASGGMDWLIQIAERMLRKHPDRITFLAPLCTFFLTVLVGTGHVVYTLMPIICDIALKKGIRPERPCGVASIASQVGITCSPIAAAVVSFVAISNANGFDITIPQVLMVSIPACICGLMAAAAASYKRGKDLDKDPVFQQKIKDPAQYEYIYGGNATTLDKKISADSKRAVYIFFGALLVIVTISLASVFKVNLLPSYPKTVAVDNAKSVKINATSIDTARVVTVTENGEEIQNPYYNEGFENLTDENGEQNQESATENTAEQNQEEQNPEPEHKQEYARTENAIVDELNEERARGSVDIDNALEEIRGTNIGGTIERTEIETKDDISEAERNATDAADGDNKKDEDTTGETTDGTQETTEGDKEPAEDGNSRALLTLHEGKTHEVRRIFAHFNKEVLELRRLELAGVKIEEGLDSCGTFRPLTQDELDLLFEATGLN